MGKGKTADRWKDHRLDAKCCSGCFSVDFKPSYENWVDSKQNKTEVSWCRVWSPESFLFPRQSKGSRCASGSHVLSGWRRSEEFLIDLTLLCDQRQEVPSEGR